MLLQQIQQPYTHTLSLLRKIDLIRLSLEFKLRTDRTDVILRDRLRVYLNSHSETLYKNPQYRPLYPQLRRPTQPALSQAPEACHLDHYSSSPTVVKSFDSSTQSCGSWNSNLHAPPPPPPPSLSIPSTDPYLSFFSNHDDGEYLSSQLSLVLP